MSAYTRKSLADYLDSYDEEMADYIAYDPVTGIFTNKKQRRRSKIGDTLGTLSADGYVRITFRYRHHLAHRLAWRLMTGKWPDHDVDHRDLDRANNRWKNLREATQSQNSANAPLTRRNTSGFKGVSFEKRRNLFQAYIGVAGRQINLGYFKTAEDAHEAYKRAAVEHFGEFARAA